MSGGNNDWYNGTVEDFREEELLTNLRVARVNTHIIYDEKHSTYNTNKVSLMSEIEVTLYDEHKINYPEV